MFKELLRKKLLQVWHNDSPGIRVYVRRNFFQDLIYPREFSGIAERHVRPRPRETFQVRIKPFEE